MASKSGHPVLTLRNWSIEIQLPSDRADGALCIMEHCLEPGYVAMPLRRHLRATLVLQVREATLSVELDGRLHTLGPGEQLAIPRGSWHTFWNSGTRPVQVREIAAPGGLDRYYEAVAPLIPPGGKPNTPAVLALSEPHSLEFDLGSLVEIIDRHRVRLA